MKIAGISKYQDLKYRKWFRSDHVSYVNNLPFGILAYLNPNLETKQIDLEVYLDASSIDDYLKATYMF